MSAFVCDPDHIKGLAMFAASRSPWSSSLKVPAYWLKYYGGKDMSGHPDNEVATYYANVLYHENRRSVAYRYDDPDMTNLPGPHDQPADLEVTKRDIMNRRQLPPLQILKMVRCLEYQSCETEEWTQTVAFFLCIGIKDAAISILPGYEESPGW